MENFAAHIVLGVKKFDRISQRIKTLNSLPVNGELYLNDVAMVFRCVNKLVPGYLFGKFNLRLHIHTMSNLQTL